MDDERRDFFVSYTRADQAWAEWIAWVLEEADYSVFVQAWDFRPGPDFILGMQRASETAERTIAVLSPSYFDSPYAKAEWAAAVAKELAGQPGALLPVRVRECQPGGILGTRGYIDLVGLDEDAAAERLLAGVSLGRAKPGARPRFPVSFTGRTRGASAPGALGDRVPPKRFPGALPSIWNVPHQRNPHFTGREELLTRLEKALASGPAAITQAITGLGGVGKTQLATEYCYRHAADYELVWWIRSEETAALAAGYADLAGPLGLGIEDEQDQRLIVEGVRRALEQRRGWLLVFDNAENRQQVRGFLPRGGGHVIVTSRDPVWGGVARPLAVRTWPRDESVQFLLKRTGDEDEGAASDLAQALGDFPLALEHAAAYVERTGCSLAHYLELFRESHEALWARAKPPDEYHATIATTWTLAFQRLREESPAAADLLNLCAFLAPDDIPREIIVEGADELPERLAEAVRDPVSFDDLIAALRRYSLIEASDDALSAHRLVQTVTRDGLNLDAGESWASHAAAVVNAAFPYDCDDVRTWDECSRLLPHALAAAEAAQRLGVAPRAAGRMLNQVGLYLRSRGDLAGAKRALQHAVAIGEAAYGPDHPSVATAASDLGGVSRAPGDLPGARAWYEREFAIGRSALEAHYRSMATDASNRGDVLRARGNMAGAMVCYKQALAIFETVVGAEDPDVATVVNNLGLVLYDLANLEAARECFERALAIDEAASGPNDPNVATDLSNLGSVLLDLSDLENARACFERALAIDKAAFGANDPYVATDIGNLGRVLQDEGDLAGARERFEQALAIDEDASGSKDPSVAIDLNNLGSVLQDQGDLEGARACFERALRIWRQFLGDEHPHTKLARGNLEGVERAMREAEEE